MHQAPPQAEALDSAQRSCSPEGPRPGSRFPTPSRAPAACRPSPREASRTTRPPHDVRNRLPHSSKERFVLSIESDDARQRRIATTAAQLSEGRR